MWYIRALVRNSSSSVAPVFLISHRWKSRDGALLLRKFAPLPGIHLPVRLLVNGFKSGKNYRGNPPGYRNHSRLLCNKNAAGRVVWPTALRRNQQCHREIATLPDKRVAFALPLFMAFFYVRSVSVIQSTEVCRHSPVFFGEHRDLESPMSFSIPVAIPISVSIATEVER